MKGQTHTYLTLAASAVRVVLGAERVRGRRGLGVEREDDRRRPAGDHCAPSPGHALLRRTLPSTSVAPAAAARTTYYMMTADAVEVLDSGLAGHRAGRLRPRV
ncbi:unnamed protein product [Knipowitschia caucasica]|uniref:Uncharacterized protein n=1 Tax=Knipowitschia caucasica TaxID=637954 RepID=A0AAV2LZM1_KNICA